MKKQTFWSDASRYGAILGGVEIVFLLAGALLRGNGLLSLLELVVFIYLLYRFTNRRAALYGAAEGYSYGNGLRFILWTSIFAGILCGAYEIVARNWLFPAYYHEQLQQSLVALSQLKLSNAQLSEVQAMSEKVSFSPIWIVLGDTLGMLLRGLFFGLFVAAFTRREPDIFNEE